MNDQASWAPTRKWIARTVVAIAGLLTTWASTGTWDKEETIMAITIGTAALVSYLVPNGSDDLKAGRLR